jgi:23S rRNA (guanosine2251-2'-O)-methyltransferase
MGDRRPPPRGDQRPGGRPTPGDEDRPFDDAVRDVAQPFVDRAPDREAGYDRPRPSGPRDFSGRPPAPRPGPGYGPRDRGYGPPQRRPLPPSLEGIALGEGEELVAGRRPVEEAFVARREARRLLVVPQRRMALEKLVLHATSLRIPVVEVEGGSLTAIAGFDGHQGIALVVAPRRWAAPDDVLALASRRGEAPLVLVLDSLEDPQNVGTLLRTAEATGVHGAIFPTRHQAPLTPAAVKASAGAVEHLQLAPVDDLAAALADLHSRGLRIVGADGEAQLTAREADLRGPVAIVVGSEGKGLGPAVRKRCDLLVRIPMHGRIDSLNAAVAGSILLYEAASQRGITERAASTAAPEPTEEPTEAPDGDPAEAPASSVAPEVQAADIPADDMPTAVDADEAVPEPAASRPRARRVTMVTSIPVAGAAARSAKPPKGKGSKALVAAADEDPIATAGPSKPDAARTRDGSTRDKATKDKVVRDKVVKDKTSPKDKSSPKVKATAKTKSGSKDKSGSKATQSSPAADPTGADDLLPGGPRVD